MALKYTSFLQNVQIRVQGSAKKLWPGLVNFVPAVAYNLCLNLPAAFMQPGQSLLADPCREKKLLIFGIAMRSNSCFVIYVVDLTL